MYRGAIDEWVEQNRKRILGLLRTLISIPSENRYPKGDEKELQTYLAGYLGGMGCETDVFLPTEAPGLIEHPAYLGGREYEDRPNVVGVKRGTGGGRSLLFSCHADTVHRGEGAWTVDPFSGAVSDGRLYGLGALDMKGGASAAIMALQCLDELGLGLAGDVTIESVADEEFGGANGTLASRLRGYGADAAIVPEPSNLAICPANQGGGMFRVTFEGKAGRSFSGEELVNPAYAGARFLEIFRRYEARQATKKSASGLFAEDPGPPAYVQGVRAGPKDAVLFDRVPSAFSVDLWIQCYPGTTEDELREDFTAFCEEKAQDDELLSRMPPRVEKLIRFLPGTSLPEGHPVIDVARDASREVLGEKAPVRGAPFACDSFVFNLHSDTPALIWGPEGGNAHAADEYVEVEALLSLVKMYALALLGWCGANEPKP